METKHTQLTNTADKPRRAHYVNQPLRRRVFSDVIVNSAPRPDTGQSQNIPPKPSARQKRPITTQESVALVSKQKTINDNQNLEEVEESLLVETSHDMRKPNNSRFAVKNPVAEHIAELRKRALYSVIALLIGGILGYRLQEEIIAVLVKPLGQQLFYTSPTGGFDFLIKICLFFGFILAIPVIIYNFIKFVSPAIPTKVTYNVAKLVMISVALALCGIAFAYFISLPSALYFLNNFTNDQIQSLISAQEYFNFVMIYLAGFAALFQMPLIIAFINKVTPLKPLSLLKKQRVVILGSFIVAAILTPTPDPINQVLMAAPIIGLYQTSIGVVWHTNKRSAKRGRKYQLAGEMA